MNWIHRQKLTKVCKNANWTTKLWGSVVSLCPKGYKKIPQCFWKGTSKFNLFIKLEGQIKWGQSSCWLKLWHFCWFTCLICNTTIILEQPLKEGALFCLDTIRTSKHQAAFRPNRVLLQKVKIENEMETLVSLLLKNMCHYEPPPFHTLISSSNI